MTDMQNVFLEARHLEFSYAPTKPVIFGASLTLLRGKMGAMIGPNGCGKSTMIRLLTGLLIPSSGRIEFDGRSLASIDRHVLAKKIAYVPQSTSRTFPFTALEVVLTGRSPYIPRFEFESNRDVAKALESLDTVGVSHLANRRVTELSGGERQLVSVARALAQEPACLLLDEPSASLDLKHRASLMRTLSNLRSQTGLTVLMVTHDLSLLDPGFDVIFAMRNGVVEAQGTPAEVLRKSVLAGIYDDPSIFAQSMAGRTFVWSEA
jgi:iron complex transport system ATP-binding protein